MASIDLLISPLWKDYSLLDSGNGERLEQVGSFVVRRPDPQVLWARSLPDNIWETADAWYVKGNKEDSGEWKLRTKMPEKWKVAYNSLQLWAELTPFKHVGIFPEQAAHWEWMESKLKKTSGERPQVLNLFGYTGGASIACALAGAFVTHVDASKPSIGWAKENQSLNGVKEDSIRWILEDVLAFVKREVRRGKKYDAIIMDPPAFGHGAKGELWKFHTHFPQLMECCGQLLSERPLFVVVNAYAVSVSALLLERMLKQYLKSFNGQSSCGELILQQKDSDNLLSTGIYGRWEK